MKPAIFVFGSNLAGRHGKGAALTAKKKYGAVRGVGAGRTGNAYAIPTKDAQQHLQPLPLDEIDRHVREFLNYARMNPDLSFALTPIGTGLSGRSKREIWTMLKGYGLTPNIYLTASWVDPSAIER